MALGLATVSACGSSGKPYIPVDSPILSWQPPENQESSGESTAPDAAAKPAAEQPKGK